MPAPATTTVVEVLFWPPEEMPKFVGNTQVLLSNDIESAACVVFENNAIMLNTNIIWSNGIKKTSSICYLVILRFLNHNVNHEN